jgi:hypothetical protein
MEKLIRIKIYFASGKSVEYHTKEYSDGNNELCFWQGKTEISVNLKNIVCIELEDVEVDIGKMVTTEKELMEALGHNTTLYTSDVKDEFEPGYIYYKCLKNNCVHNLGMIKNINPLTGNLSPDERKKRELDIVTKTCPICRSRVRILYI